MRGISKLVTLFVRDLSPWAKKSQGRSQYRAKYADHIQSPVWFQRRDTWAAEELRRRGDKGIVCLGCGKPWQLHRDDMHHANYQRLGHEAHEDLWPLHRGCHTRLHELMSSSRSWRKLGREFAGRQALLLVQRDHGGIPLDRAAKSLRDYL